VSFVRSGLAFVHRTNARKSQGRTYEIIPRAGRPDASKPPAYALGKWSVKGF
jgi:hypothetical protein